MNRLDVWIDDASLGGSALIGRLTKTANRTGDTISFEYDAGWLAGAGPVAAFPLDHALHLGAGPHYAKAGASALSGIFQDGAPDRWGQRLMDRREAIEAREAGRKVRNLRARVIWSASMTRPAWARCVSWMRSPIITWTIARSASRRPPSCASLKRSPLTSSAATPICPAEMVRWIKQIVAPGASLGGARPKASFRDPSGQLWLAKFPSLDDRIDVGLWEYLTYQLSRDAGIDMPEAKLMQLSDRGHTYAVQRFDRTPTSRRMFSSADATGRRRERGCSYLDLVRAIETSGTSTQIARELEQLFRRVLFNILIGNRDDHLRNHGFLRVGDGWQLSPAFDVNPNRTRIITCSPSTIGTHRPIRACC
ncbi:MAG: type II toxin-antitoxin system HipA family toxin [Xanthomonadales bacterium]|nr:type II toxin-antitoxin system HipA family toxin [Xanthomonadales bacterium]